MDIVEKIIPLNKLKFQPKIDQKIKLTDLLSKQRGDATLDKLAELLQIVNQRGLRSCDQADEDLKLLNVSFIFYACKFIHRSLNLLSQMSTNHLPNFNLK
jgi:hypothetical protein